MAKLKQSTEKVKKETTKAKDIFGDLPPLPEAPELILKPNTAPAPESNLSEAPFEVDSPLELQEENPSEAPALNFEKVLERDLAKYDAVSVKIQELNKLYMPLKITSVDDTEGYKEVTTALKFMVSKRTEVEGVRKALKADALAYGKAVDERAKEITAKLAPIEEHLRAQKEAVDKELALIEERKEEERKAEILARHNRLIAAGMMLVNDTYIFDDGSYETIHALNLETMDADAFGAFSRSVEKLHQEAIERKQKEEADRIEEQKRQAAERERLAKEGELLKKQQDEMAAQMKAMQEERYNARKESLELMGLEFSQISPFVFYKGFTVVSQNEIKDASAAEFTAIAQSVKSKKESIDSDITKRAEEAEQQRKDREEEIKKQALIDAADNARKSVMAALGFKLTGDNRTGVYTYLTPKGTISTTVDLLLVLNSEDEEFDEIIESLKTTISDMVELEAKNIAKEQELANKAIEDERVANLSDKEKMSEYAQKLLAVSRPEMATKKWAGLVVALHKSIGEYLVEKN